METNVKLINRNWKKLKKITHLSRMKHDKLYSKMAYIRQKYLMPQNLEILEVLEKEIKVLDEVFNSIYDELISVGIPESFVQSRLFYNIEYDKEISNGTKKKAK